MIGNITSDILVALVVLGVIIVIHEFGHFAVAKLFRIKVETFSVGFGPRLVGFRHGETDYRISALPLGGYVKMAGENPSDNITGDPREFLSKPKWQRFLVAAAGPIMNVILAVILMAGLYTYGSEVPEFLNDQATIGFVEPGSPAETAGIKPGDQIVSFDGKDNPTWEDLDQRVVTNPDRTISFVVERGGQRIAESMTLVHRGPSDSGYAGMGPMIRTIVQVVQPGSPAEAAGVKTGDEIVGVAGIDLKTSGRTIQDTIQKVPDATFPITVIRAGKSLDLPVTPAVRDGRRIIGVEFSIPTVLVKLGPVAAVQRSVSWNEENGALIFQVLGRILKRQSSLKSLDGPIGIVRASGQALDVGPAALITLTAMISLNLGVVNALPIPIMDGGVMLLLLIESLMGRDLTLSMKEKIVQVSMVFLLVLIVVVLYNDVVKLLPTSAIAP